ncbi:uncharacterized protein LOC129591458 [Paramacrobiotus metropolitanus]|uniref:uncharacterized protein LOC129591458 n=1 Tax=Paramacrobiotus metropolitanus TaxID=2943436 RepID=UPI002445E428|nr:uncharacterized protein LOC129591458 [Paramacrobiotus metropolitanus]
MCGVMPVVSSRCQWTSIKLLFGVLPPTITGGARRTSSNWTAGCLYAWKWTLSHSCAPNCTVTRTVAVFWNEGALEEACHNCLLQQPLRNAGSISAADSDAVNSKEDITESTRITDLPHPILALILQNMDFCTQLQSSRVCALWELLLRKDVSNRRNVIVEIGQTPLERYPEKEDPSVEYHSSAYASDPRYQRFVCRLIPTLDRVLTQHTETLTLIEEGPGYERCWWKCAWRLMTMVRVLQAKGIRVPLLIVKNACDPKEKGEHGLTLLELKPMSSNNEQDYVCSMLSQLMTVCQELLLINHTVRIPTGQHSPIMRLFGNDPLQWPDGIDGGQWFHVIRDDRYGPNGPPALLDIIIPLLRIPSTDTAAEQRQRFLSVLNDNCPAVTPRVRKKVKAVHARWVRKWTYPDRWTAIRVFLNLFSGFRSDDSPRSWDAVDLRKIDISMLSKLALTILDGYYKC